MKANLAITGIGMLTPVGLCAADCVHSVRSGISRLEELQYHDTLDVAICGGSVTTWVRGLRASRLQQLARLGIVAAWNQAMTAPAAAPGPAALLLGAPEKDRPGYRFPAAAGPTLSRWATGLGPASFSPVEVIPASHCSAVRAFERAQQLLGGGEVRACVIGAADTQLQLRLLRWHENRYRLKCSYVNDGLMPGEAACFLVVESLDAALARKARILARILSVGIDRESATVLSDQPNTAKGLTNAARTALKDAGIEAKALGAVWCDLNGESYRAREWAFTEIRLGVQTHTELIHPADCHGDLGAASDANLLGLAAMAQATGWAQGKPSLVFGGSEIEGWRAAAVIAPPPEQKPPPQPQVMIAMPRVVDPAPTVPALGPDEVDFPKTDDPARAYFDWQLRQEHLDDLAALHYQRKGILGNSEIPWPRLREPEQRILNHLDAVLAGGPTSIWAVASGLLDGEEGKAFAGALLLAILPTPANFARLNEALKPAGPFLAGVEAALRQAPPSKALVAQVEAWLDHANPAICAMAVSVLGYRRELEPRRIVPFIQSDAPPIRSAGIQAARRRRYLAAVPALERHLAANDPNLVHESLLTLLCLGVRNGPERCRNLVMSRALPAAQAPFLLALCGQLPDLFVLIRGEKALEDPVTLSALGVLGNVKAAVYLFQALDSKDEAVRVAAAEALELIAASGLRETAVVDDRKIERVATSADAWRDWWSQHGRRFDPQRRWRRGQPFDFGVFIAEMKSPSARFNDRQRAYWELLIHTGQSIPFEPDWFVPRQLDALTQWESWWAANRPRQ